MQTPFLQKKNKNKKSHHKSIQSAWPAAQQEEKENLFYIVLAASEWEQADVSVWRITSGGVTVLPAVSWDLLVRGRGRAAATGDGGEAGEPRRGLMQMSFRGYV